MSGAGRPETTPAGERLDLIARIAGAIARAQPLDALAQEMAGEVCSSFGIDACVIRLLEDDRLVLLASAGMPDEGIQAYIPTNEGIAAEIIRGRRPMCINDVRVHPATAMLASRESNIYHFISYAGAPLLMEDQVLGIIGLYATAQKRDFTRVELAQLQIIADNIAVSITNARLYREINAQKLRLEEQIAERTRAEDERRRLEAQLRHAQKMEAIGQLAGGVAHDFNNLLTVILGNVGTILHSAEERSEAVLGSIVGPLNEVERAARRGAALTRQLLTVSRGQLTAPQVIDPGSLIQGMGDMLRRPVGEHNRIDIRCDADIDHILADPGEIEQAILNLVLNARDAMPGGGRISIEAANVVLDEQHVRDCVEARVGPHVMVAVSDSGEGMSEQVLSHIFELFYTTKPVGRGTGLGLSIVYATVKRCGGHVVVRSKPDVGTTVRLYFPSNAGKAAASARPVESLWTRGEETILVCEDQEMVRRLTCGLLRDAGYTVVEAGDAQQALEMARGYAGQVDALVTDVIMPEVNGRELATELKRQRPDLRVMFMSGYTSDVLDAERVSTSGAAFLQKPFRPHELLHKVRELLDRSQTAAGGLAPRARRE
ncbi:MAG: response regulator [bacterium]|nr:response regulator [bacterium]